MNDKNIVHNNNQANVFKLKLEILIIQTKSISTILSTQ